MFNKNYNVCNNCGKQGHLYNSCKIPITSYGVISFKKNKEYEYLMICRKDSLGYVDFIRGKYPLYNKKYIQNLVDEMTVQEKNNILTKDFYDLWNQLWCSENGMQYRVEEKSSKNKFDQIKRGIQLSETDKYDIYTLIENSKTNWITPEWGFPKGRRNYGEKDMQAALREWCEETGYPIKSLNIISNILPYDEFFVGSNFKSYKHKYYLAYIKNDFSNTNYQKSEVSELKWFTYEECLKHIRPYNLERIEIVNKINKILHKYSLI
jgi:8-oxo-dGTP pyrophosphatase MutT (NUDIX family)